MKLSTPTALSLLTIAQLGAAAVPNLLLFSRTVGYRHDSIPTAIDAIANISTSTNMFNLTASEDQTLFTDAGLEPFSVIAFLSNSDQVLTSSGEKALQRWLEKGGGFVGLHAATACLFNDTAFGVAMGSWFDYHPTIQNVTFTKVVSHPTIDMLPDEYRYEEECYHFRTDPRDVGATVLLSYDNTSLMDTTFGTTGYYQGTPAPIAWYRDGADTPVDLYNLTSAAESNSTFAGRTWYTSLGHTNATWESPLHLAHVQAGLQWVIDGLATDASVNTTSTASTASSATATSTATRASHSASSATAATSASVGTTSAAAAASTSASSTTSLGSLSHPGLGTALLGVAVALAVGAVRLG